MKNRKRMRFVCLLLLCATLTGILQPAKADVTEKVKAVRILKMMGNLTPINETNLLIAQDFDTSKWGVYDTDGNVIIPLQYENLSSLGYGFLSVGSVQSKKYKAKEIMPVDELNCHALMRLDETRLTDYQYGLFKVFSPLWGAGLVMKEGTKSDYDYTADGKHFFLIDRYDIFYLGAEPSEIDAEFVPEAESALPAPETEIEPDAEAEPAPEAETALPAAETDIEAETEPAPEAEAVPEPEADAEPVEIFLAPILSLTPDQYKDAAAHGDYLYLQDREDKLTVYDKQGSVVDFEIQNLRSSMYGIKNWMLINLLSGEMVMDGCSGVTETQLSDELLLSAARINFQGKTMNSLITLNGETIIPMWNGAISSVSKDYVILTSNEDGKKGLYSLRDSRVVLPCVYDEIYENKSALDHFINHGFISVKKDGVDCSYDLETQTFIPVVESEDALTRYGSTYYSTKKASLTTTTQLISPEGNVKSLFCSIVKTRGSGYLMVGKFSDGYNVFTWNGKTLLPQNYSKSIVVTDDDRFITNTQSAGYELYKVVVEQPAEKAAEQVIGGEE